MKNMNIAGLEKNEATRPFRIAAAVSGWDGLEELSENETLLYTLHQERPETDIRSMTEAKTFLASLEPSQSQAIQNKAKNMYGIATLLAEGATEKLPGLDWKMEDVEIPAENYRGAYFKNSNLSFDDLKKQVAASEEKALLRQYQKGTSDQIARHVLQQDVRSSGVPLALGMGGAFEVVGAIGFMAGGMTVIAPTLIAVGLGAAVIGVGLTNGGPEFRNDVKSVLQDAWQWSKDSATSIF